MLLNQFGDEGVEWKEVGNGGGCTSEVINFFRGHALQFWPGDDIFLNPVFRGLGVVN